MVNSYELIVDAIYPAVICLSTIALKYALKLDELSNIPNIPTVLKLAYIEIYNSLSVLKLEIVASVYEPPDSLT
jgi:hypothetical protein